MRVHNSIMLCAVCVGMTIVVIIIGIIDFPFADVTQTVCGTIVLLCLIVMFVSFNQQNDGHSIGSLIINEADELYLVLDNDISELRKKSHVDLTVYLSHSS